jgi:hypothetical protein
LIPRLSFGRLWLALAVILPVLGALTTPLSTVDLAYHVRVGGTILDSGRIPSVDSLTFTAAGQSWLDQQWGAQVVLAAIHRLAGWEGLAVVRAVLIGSLFGLVAAACLVSGAGMRRAAWLTLAAFVIAVVTLALRPQLFGMLLFAASLLVVALRERRPGLVWLLPVLAIVWANTHGSFVLAPAIAGAAWLSDIASGAPRARRMLAITIVTLAATLVTPFGPAVWSYAAGLTTNPLVTSRITEWQPTSPRTFAGLAFYGSALLVAAYLARRPGRTPWPTLAWLGFLFALGAFAERGVAWWPLGAVVAVSAMVAEDGRQGAVRDSREPRPSRLNGAIVIVLIAACVAVLPWWRAADPLTGRRDLLADAPALPLVVVAETPVGARLFVPQRWGSWFEWAVPDRPVFVDSRVELFPVAVWADEAAISAGLEGWQTALDRWAIDAVVTDARDGPDLATRMAAQPGWREVASGADGRLFVRR